MSIARFNFIEGQVDAFVSGSEQWRQEHDDAMVCYDVEDGISVGCSLFDILEEADTKWRLAIARGEQKYSVEMDRAITTLLSGWYKGTLTLLDAARMCEQHGFAIKGIDELRRRAATAREVLEEDEAQAA